MYIVGDRKAQVTSIESTKESNSHLITRLKREGKDLVKQQSGLRHVCTTLLNW